MIKATIDKNIEADIKVSPIDLDTIYDEFELTTLSLNKYDPSYMRGDELTITDKNYKSKTVLLPKKKAVTVAWIIEKVSGFVNSEKVYIKLAQKVKKISEKMSDASVYPTSYGIGIHTLYKNTKGEEKAVRDLLDAFGIEYSLQWSDAFWVMRILISKSKVNLEKIEALTDADISLLENT